MLSELKSGARIPCSMAIVTGRGNRSGDEGVVLQLQVRAFFLLSMMALESLKYLETQAALLSLATAF